MVRLLRIASVALLLAACEEQPPGRKLAAGIGSRIAVRDGAAAFLVDAAHPDDRTVPEDLAAGDLWLDARKVGSGVSSQPGAFAFSPRGLVSQGPEGRHATELALLSGWRFRAGAGELWTAAPGAEPVQVAPEARSFAWSPDGSALAFVAPDKLGLRGKAALPLPGLSEIAWAPDGKRIAARAAASAGGKLYLVEVATGALREVAPGTSDFAFAADGTLAALGPPPPKGGDRPLLLDGKEIARATAFSFSPDSKEVALLSTQKQPGEAFGDLLRMKPGSAAQPVASRVSDWRWGPQGDLLCLSRFDLRARAGTLTADGREIASRVQSFSIFGRRVLYLVQAPQKGDFKLELWGVDLASPSAPHKIDEGVYGWDLSGDTLFYKARCAGGPRTCSLLRVPFAGAVQPEVLAADVAGFDLSRDGERILIEEPHRGASRAVDLAIISAKGPPLPLPLKPFVLEVDPSSRFADAAGKRVVYALTTPGKAGVYLADVP